MRVLAVFCGAFALGIFLSQYLLSGAWLLPCAFACLALAALALALPPWWRRRCVLIGAALALALGYDWLYLRTAWRPMEALSESEAVVSMTLLDYPLPTGYGAKATVKLDDLPGKAVYYGDETLLSCVPGQRLIGPVRFQSAGRIRDDDVTAFTSKGVFLLAYQRGELTVGQGDAGGLRWWPARVGHAMKAEIAALFEGDTAGFLTAILTGDKSGLSESAAADLSEAGLYHILAVSGMHCGFLLTMVYLLTGKQRRRLTALCVIPLLCFYALLTGGAPSVLRSCVMLSLLVAAPLFRRDSDGPTALCLALFLILLANPFAAASISLQLSFAAMSGILFLTPRLYKLLRGTKKHGKVFTFIATGFSATMGALVFTVPLSALYFGTLVLISPLRNLLCLWAAGIVFLGGLAAVVLGFCAPPLGAAVGVVPGLLARYILLAAHGLARVPYHAVYLKNSYLVYWLVFAYALFAAVYLLRAGGRRSYALAAVLASATLALTVFLGAARYGSALDAVVLDVGQGESVVLASHGAYALVDCGSANGWYAPGEDAAHQLRTMGCGRLDYLILTHYDFDHISGVTALLARLEVAKLLVPRDGENEALCAAARDCGVEVAYITEKATLPLGDAHLTVYPPLGKRDDNERGLSVLASAGERDVLITGDMDAATEQALLSTYSLADIEALVAGHHGSKNSTSAALLDALTPETVAISVGAANRYGHPAQETLRRLAEQGCAVYRTDLQGDIHLSMN
ncbi:DNA internalization-related competence protein ComEC/Rec2 [Oscillibacter sp.]|uniref:DNA internalization-related competence protein ComEC/Rec2 n=1 Tax=Oscillibacter sp. TaxID=1945593 RepID=UPI002631C9E8|nr:DNA internalization-related competence protein ComEC/Rec2 [Oscillibacter sp.]MDD3347136.1 DNA internalization-related competence protein ComEC/Rec2 [Oscillibacter sp.]